MIPECCTTCIHRKGKEECHHPKWSKDHTSGWWHCRTQYEYSCKGEAYEYDYLAATPIRGFWKRINYMIYRLLRKLTTNKRSRL